VLLTEKDAYWINVADDLYFLKDGKRFLWSSERSGYRHLYLYGLDGKESAQLTKGDWEVTGLEESTTRRELYISTPRKRLRSRGIYTEWGWMGKDSRELRSRTVRTPSSFRRMRSVRGYVFERDDAAIAAGKQSGWQLDGFVE